MFSESVTGLTHDPGLLTLAQVLKPELMLQVLAQVAGLRPEDVTGLSCSGEVLSHKLGKRCTIQYTLTRTSEQGQPINFVRVIGKVYARQELAGRLYRRTENLRRGPFNDSGPLCIPAPLKLVQNLGLVLQEYVDAEDLLHVLSRNNSNRPLSLAGHWLARLHTALPLAGLRTMSLPDELENVDRWCEYIGSYLRTADAQRLNQAQDTLHRFAGKAPPYAPVMIHKDFYHGNVLWDGQRVWVLDFDELSIGDPALDLGHFLAHLETLGYHVAGREDAFAQAAASLLSAYREKTGLHLESRLPFHRAYTFLKLAATEVSRKQGEWQRNLQVLTVLACREVERLLEMKNE